MKRTIVWSAFIVFFLPCSAEALDKRSSKKECCLCHVLWAEAFVTHDETLVGPRESTIIVAGSIGLSSSREMCTSCHDGYVADSRAMVQSGNKHQLLGKVPDWLKLPEPFRLDRNNEFYCGTCHGFHDVMAEGAIGQTPFVRMDNDRSQMCTACHVDKTEKPANTNHPVLKKPEKPPFEEAHRHDSKLGPEGEIICQSCHATHAENGLIAPIDNSSLCFFCHSDKENSGPFLERNRPLHPVHVRPSPEMAGDVKSFISARPPNRLGKEGEVECLSCHSMHRGELPSMLVGKGGEDFCGSCHREQAKKVSQTKHNLVETASHEKNRLGQSPKRSGMCRTCHLAHGWAPRGTVDRDDVSRLCLSCHSRSGVAKKTTIGEHTHPVGRVPEHMKEDSPLKLVSSGGKATMACSTCHDPHVYDPDLQGVAPSLEEEGDSTNSFLRLAGKDLCRHCHEDRFWIEGTKHDLREPEVTCSAQERLTAERDGVCAGCHTVHNAEGPYLWARVPYPSSDMGGRLCGGCHSEGQCGKEKKLSLFTHPVSVSLSENMKTDLPVYNKEGTGEKNTLACFTCHDAHRWTVGPEKEDPHEDRFAEGGGLNSFLRFPNDSSSTLCLSCHPEKAFVARTDHDMRFSEPDSMQYAKLSMESSVCQGCHVPHGNDPKKMLWVEGVFGEGTDMHQACSGCHRKEGRAHEKILEEGHPMSPSDDSGDAFTVSKVVDGQIVRSSITMTCRTCHDPHRWSPEKDEPVGTSVHGAEGNGSNSFLTVPTLPDGDLCLSCHHDMGSIRNTKHDMRNYLKEKDRIDEALGKRVIESGLCSACHLVHNPKKQKYLWAYDFKAGKSLPEKMCFGCHSAGKLAEQRVPREYSHPDVRLTPAIQKAKIPSHLAEVFEKCVVYENNDSVNCFTCHNPHKWDPENETTWQDVRIEESDENKFLRVRNDEHVCKICHGLEGLYRYLYFHQWDRISGGN